MTFIAGVLQPGRSAPEICAAMQQHVPLDSSRWRTAATAEMSLCVAPSLRLPEDQFDRQPLQQNGLYMVGDIRIDNRDELAPLLGWSIGESQKKADSDFFLAAWERWGTEALRHVIGGFAVAIWDAGHRELTLLRDHVGERSLYFLHVADTVAFASLPGPLRAVPDVDTSLDEIRLIHHLAVLPGTPTQTFFKNIHQLPLGHMASFRNGSMTLARYWHPLNAPAVRFQRDEEYVEALRERFDRAVAARLRTTGNVGSQLSGGMDSSSVTVTAARLLGSRRITAFTSVPHPAFANLNPVGRFGDEGPAAAEVAAMYPNIDHVLVESSQGDMIGGAQAIGLLQGQPVFNLVSEMWFKAIFDMARCRGITVMLQGVCGNATISAGGLVGLSELLRSGRWVALAKLMFLLRKKGHASLRGSASSATGPFLPLWLRRRLAAEPAAFDFSFSPVHPHQAVAHKLAEKTWNEFYGADRSTAGFQRQMFEYFDGGFVNVATTLGWEVELRDPTQDKRIFEYCFAIPIEQYLAGGQTRSLVRRAMRGYLPESTLARTTRGLQSADWFLTMGARRQEMTEELARIRMSPMANRVLDLDRLGWLLENWPTQGFELASVSDSWHLALSRGLAVGNFIRQFE